MLPSDPLYKYVRAVARMRGFQTSPTSYVARTQAEAEVDELTADLLRPALPDLDALFAQMEPFTSEELGFILPPIPLPVPELPEGGYR